MITLIEPESGLMDCIGPKLDEAKQAYTVVALKDFSKNRSVEFGQKSILSAEPIIERYWLGVDIRSISKNMLQTFCDVEDASIWINEPIRAWQAQYYGYQLRLAELSGFKIPNTLISNNVTNIETFRAKHNDAIINLMAAEIDSGIQMFRQAITGGDRIRVYVFGSKTFAFNLGPFREFGASPRVPDFIPMDSIVSKSLTRFMRMSRLDFGIFDLCQKNNQDIMWICFSTDIEKLAEDDKRIPRGGLCDALANILVETV